MNSLTSVQLNIQVHALSLFQDRNDRYLKSLPNEQGQLYLLLPLSTEALITNQYNCE